MTKTNRIKFYNFALRRPFDLQRFADDGGDGGDPNTGNDPADDNPEEGQNDPQDDSKAPKYTEEDMQRALRRKAAEVNKKRDKEEKEKSEAERLRTMSDEEKRAHEFKEMQKELAALKNERALGEMAKTARGLLADRHINVSDDLIKNLISTDAEATKSAVDSFAAAFEKAVQDAVAERLKGKAPTAGSTNKKITKEEILAVKDRRERQRLINENMDLFNTQK